MCIALYRLYRRVNAMWIKCGQFSNLRGGALKSRMSSASMPRWAKAAKAVLWKSVIQCGLGTEILQSCSNLRFLGTSDTVATVASNPLDEATEALCGSFLAQRTELYSWDRLNCIFFSYFWQSAHSQLLSQRKNFSLFWRMIHWILKDKACGLDGWMKAQPYVD